MTKAVKSLLVMTGLALLAGSCGEPVARDRLHVVKWGVSHYATTMRNGTDVGPSLAASAFILNDETGRLVQCSANVDLKTLDKWSGSPLSCRAVGSKQASAPDHQYSIVAGGGKPAEDFPFVQYFRLDQTAKTVSFCFAGIDFTSCSADTPLPR